MTALRKVLAGVLLASSTAGLSFALCAVSGLTFLSPIVLAVLLAMSAKALIGTPDMARAGLLFSQRVLLRIAIVLLGLQITLTEVIGVGWAGLAIIMVTVAGTMVFTCLLGTLLGIDRKLAELIAAGTAICGASAIAAANTVAAARNEDVSYALVSVTFLGTLAMLAYPILAGLFEFDSHGYGIWAGASIHEIAQVAAASFQAGEAAGNVAMVVKLARVLMLAPVIVALSWLVRRRACKAGTCTASAPVFLPWFIVGFATLVVLNSVVGIDADIRAALRFPTSALMATALAALGWSVDLNAVKRKGTTPLFLAVASWLFIAIFSGALVKLAL